MKPSDTFTLILNYHVSPEHGWVEVPATLVDRLRILDAISEYSYYSHNKQVYYLEEDADVSILVKALKSQGYECVFRDVPHDSRPNFTRCARVGQE